MLRLESAGRNSFIIFGISLAFVLINSFLIANRFWYFSLFPLLIIILWLAFFYSDRLLLLIVLFVPFSVPLSRLGVKTGSDLYLPTEPILALLVLLFFLNYLRGQRLDRSLILHPLSVAIYINIAWIFFTSLTSTMPLVSFKYLLSRIWFVVPFYFLAAAMFKSLKKVKRYFLFYIIPFSLLIIFVNFKLFTHGMNLQQASNYVVDPFFSDHTSYGAVVAMLIPLIAGMAILSKRGTGKILLFFLLAFFIAALVLSYTRAAWLSIMVAVGMWIILLLKIRPALIITGLAVITILIFSYQGEIFLKAKQNEQVSSGDFREHLQSVANIRNDVSNLERINRWNSAIRMFREKPLTGFGPGTYMFRYAPYQVSYEKTEISTNAGIRGNAHSEYLGPLAEQGIIGLLSMLSIVGITLITGLRVYYRSPVRKVRIVVLSVMLGLVTYYIHGIMNNFLDTDKASALFWGFSAVIVVYDLKTSRLLSGKLNSED